MLQKLINEILNENNNFEELIKNEIKANIEKSVKKVVDEVICYRYSKFSETLHKKLEEQLSVNLDKIDIAQYNQVFKEKINDSITQIVNDETREKIKKSVDGILYQELKEEYNLSELLEDFKREIAQWDDDIEEVYLCINNEDSFKTVYLDKEKPKYNNYECKYKILFFNNKLIGITINEGNKEEVILKNNSFSGLLKNIYLQGKKIKLDFGDDDSRYDTEINREYYND